jgi:hypothetical protein
MSKLIITDLETALQAIIAYFDPDSIQQVKRIEKSALIETLNNYYYFKFDRKPWFNAGYETGGKFSGAGFAINADVFKTIDERYNAEILYCNLPNTVYHFNLESFKKNSIKHVQKYNGEEVRVISLYQANEVFYI